jgi:hypothetical protein
MEFVRNNEKHELINEIVGRDNSYPTIYGEDGKIK